ncbi:MAG: bifunctional lysine ketoglutarate reductase /saccharopine dehydrogenase family protein [candidate division KSB1 bacterium]|nr:bifunctional lysine ketoglutarate reductase /saccharopine dehydrogenase family protein [candidate division KSB1 bacterium]
MNRLFGIRREDKNRWERRVPLTPHHVQALCAEHGLQCVVQSSPIRVFSDDQYRELGIEVAEDIGHCPVVFAVKEIPAEFFRPGGTYVFFAHVIKGQKHNMSMLRRLMELGCTLIDYERIVDESGKRLIFFGRHAGLAGMIDTLWALGQRLAYEGLDTPFAALQPAHRYPTLQEAKEAVQRVGEAIATTGLPEGLVPFVCGFAGYGHVSQGAQEIFDLLPHRKISPAQLLELQEDGWCGARTLYKVVFREEDMVRPVMPNGRFELQDYYCHPERYEGRFAEYVPQLSVLVNGIYWDARYPRLVTKQDLHALFSRNERPRLRVIGDISCDVEGSIECTLRATTPDDPIFVYDPLTETITPGHQGRGVVVLAVDNLPCELPRAASVYFSGVLKEYVPAIVTANYEVSFDELALPPEIKRAVIVHRGTLTPDYRYLEQYVANP